MAMPRTWAMVERKASSRGVKRRGRSLSTSSTPHQPSPSARNGALTTETMPWSRRTGAQR
jgi:hypothetical protein